LDVLEDLDRKTAQCGKYIYHGIYNTGDHFYL
jgi:hypothetical protein